MSKPMSPAALEAAKESGGAVSFQNLKDNELNETLNKVKLQVKNLVEKTQAKAKANGGKISQQDLAKAKALENLVAGVDQIIVSLQQLRK